MKKISLLITLLLAYSAGLMAQTNVPVPMDPQISDWYDYTPYQWPDGQFTVASAWLYIDTYGTDMMGNQVANDYSFELDSCFNDELLYTILDKDKFSYSIYTDFDELFVFYPEEYPEFDEPTTNIYPYLLLYDDFNDIDTYHSTANIEHWGPHFPNRTFQDGDFGDVIKKFPEWRIGIQTHYTVDGVTSSSNIVYLELCDKPVSLLGDVDDNGAVEIVDVSALIDYLLGRDTKINKFNSDVYSDCRVDISDLSELIDLLLAM